MSIDVLNCNPQVFRELAISGFSYDWERGPAQVRSERDAQMGLNCVALSHLALRKLGVQLPPDLHNLEMFTDMRGGSGKFFEPRKVDVPALLDGRGLRTGDVVWFGHPASDQVLTNFNPDYTSDNFLRNSFEHPLRHLAVATGEIDLDTGEPLLLHTSGARGAEVAPLSVIMSLDQHQTVHGVGRPIALEQRGIIL
ncbi:MAG: hypothetical protein ABWX94_00640 [Candidatus Saccharimonadales bacterium]